MSQFILLKCLLIYFLQPLRFNCAYKTVNFCISVWTVHKYFMKTMILRTREQTLGLSIVFKSDSSKTSTLETWNIQIFINKLENTFYSLHYMPLTETLLKAFNKCRLNYDTYACRHCVTEQRQRLRLNHLSTCPGPHNQEKAIKAEVSYHNICNLQWHFVIVLWYDESSSWISLALVWSE